MDFEKIENAGRVDGLLRRADSLQFQIKKEVEDLSKWDQRMTTRWFNFSVNIPKIEAKLEELTAILHRVRELEQLCEEAK